MNCQICGRENELLIIEDGRIFCSQCAQKDPPCPASSDKEKTEAAQDENTAEILQQS